MACRCRSAQWLRLLVLLLPALPACTSLHHGERADRLTRPLTRSQNEEPHDGPGHPGSPSWHGGPLPQGSDLTQGQRTFPCDAQLEILESEQIPESDHQELPFSMKKGFWQAVDLSKEDYRNYYTSHRNLALWAFGVGAAAPVANTQLDQEIRDTYQENVNSRAIDDLVEVINVAGQYWFVLPLGLELMAWKGHFGDDYWLDGGIHEWSNRSLRAIAVGFPPVVAMYGLLGGGRADGPPGNSKWRPFQDIRGISGHTFMGAIPFLTAAAMTDDPFWKTSMVLGSFLTGWSRIHKDRHYYSQVALGWWMALLAVKTVGRTQEQHRGWAVAPTLVGGAPGMALHIEY